MEKNVIFYVTGAGYIQLSDDCHCISGTSTAGFCFGASWSNEGARIGGVLGRHEAKQLAEFILDKIKDVSESEQDEVNRVRNKLLNK